jgi:hypothetical protein
MTRRGLPGRPQLLNSAKSLVIDHCMGTVGYLDHAPAASRFYTAWVKTRIYRAATATAASPQ